jgi:hypothetical protein
MSLKIRRYSSEKPSSEPQRLLRTLTGRHPRRLRSSRVKMMDHEFTSQSEVLSRMPAIARPDREIGTIPLHSPRPIETAIERFALSFALP